MEFKQNNNLFRLLELFTRCAIQTIRIINFTLILFQFFFFITKSDEIFGTNYCRHTLYLHTVAYRLYLKICEGGFKCSLGIDNIPTDSRYIIYGLG